VIYFVFDRVEKYWGMIHVYDLKITSTTYDIKTSMFLITLFYIPLSVRNAVVFLSALITKE